MHHAISKFALSVGIAWAAPAQSISWDQRILDGSAAVADHRYADAEKAFRAALYGLEGVPEFDERVPETLHQICAVYLLEGRYTEARPLCLKAATLRQRNLGNAVPTARTEVVLGMLYLLEGRYFEAERWTRRALSILESQFGVPPDEMGAPFLGLARVLLAQRKYKGAETAALRALEVWGPTDPKNQVNRANVMITLAHIAERRHQYGRSADYHARALVPLEQVFGPSHISLVQPLTSFAFLQTATRDYDKAERLARRALGIVGDGLGSQHLDFAYAALAVGIALAGQSRKEEAEPFYKNAILIFENSPDRQRYAFALRAYAQFLRGTNRRAEAKVVETRAQSTAAAPRQTVDVSEFRSPR